MNTARTIVYSFALLGGMVGIAQAQDTPADPADYKQKLHGCVTQMKTDHPDMNHDARRKACRKQLGPAPKSSAAATPMAPAKP
jgi:hypothetical protein